VNASRILWIALGIVPIVACELLVGQPYDAGVPADDSGPPPVPCCERQCPSGPIEGVAFVAPNGAGKTCTRDAPCNTVAQAIQVLGGSGTVLLAGGTYTETVDLRSSKSIAICGGYAPDTWTRTGPATAITGTGARTIENSAGPTCVILDGLELHTPSRTMNGESAYGVFASRSGGSNDLCLRELAVLVGAGGDGVPGDAGAAGMTTVCDAGADGAPGLNGDAGAPASGVVFEMDGQFIARQGTAGGIGSVGTPGAFAPATCDTMSTPCSESCKLGSGNMSGCVPVDSGACNLGGPACGGTGGAGGNGGGGGGASIGVVAVQTNVTARALRITTDRGGNGGSGGPGGSAGDPSAGVFAACPYCDFYDIFCNGPTSGVTTPATIGPAGKGGKGGTGGGGAGGWSCAFVVGGNDITTALGASTLTVGTAGMGAPNGEMRRVCFLDGGGIP
jgi:hypothetical protein